MMERGSKIEKSDSESTVDADYRIARDTYYSERNETGISLSIEMLSKNISKLHVPSITLLFDILWDHPEVKQYKLRELVVDKLKGLSDIDCKERYGMALIRGWGIEPNIETGCGLVLQSRKTVSWGREEFVKRMIDYYVNDGCTYNQLLDYLSSIDLRNVQSNTKKLIADSYLFSDSEELYRRAFNIFNEFQNDSDVQLVLAKMYYNGVGVERSQKLGRKILNKNGLNSNNYIKCDCKLNEDIFENESILIAGDSNELKILLAICMQHNVKPDYYINYGGDTLSEVFGNQYLGQKETLSLLFVELRENIGIDTENCELFSLRNKKGAKDLLLYEEKIDHPGFCSMLEYIDIIQKKQESVVDVTYFNERGCVIFKDITGSRGVIGYRTIDQIIKRYEMGKIIYSKLSDSKHYISIYSGMGDQYRMMYPREGDDRQITRLIMPNAASLIDLTNAKYKIISPSDCRLLIDYCVLSDKQNEKINFIGNIRLYPYLANSDMYVGLSTSISKKLKDPELQNLAVEVSRYEKPVLAGSYSPYFFNYSVKRVLLNPYGNWIKGAHPDKIHKFDEFFTKLSKQLLSQGYEVHINAPADQLAVYPGTIRYSRTITEYYLDSGYFDYVVSIFTGFMEAIMHSNTNVLVIRPSKTDSRFGYAVDCNHFNYNEITIDLNNPEITVDYAIKIINSASRKPNMIKRVEHSRRHLILDTTLDKITKMDNRLFTDYDAELIISGITDYETTISVLQKNAVNDKKSASILAILYHRGLHIEKDIKKALELINDNESELALIEKCKLLNDVNTEDSTKELIKILQRLVKIPNAEACSMLAMCYKNGRYVKQDLWKAATLMRIAVNNGIYWSRNNLFDILIKIGTDEAKGEAFRIVFNAPSQNTGLKYRIGLAYRYGWGTEKDLQKALLYLKQASENGNRYATHDYLETLIESGSENDINAAISIINGMDPKSDSYNHFKALIDQIKQ